MQSLALFCAVFDSKRMISGAGHELGRNRLLILKAAISAEVVVAAWLSAVEVPLYEVERLPTAIAPQVDAREIISAHISRDLSVRESHHMSFETPGGGLRTGRLRLLWCALLICNL